MADDRPAWARRMYNERQARGWSQADAIRAMRAHSPASTRPRSCPARPACCGSTSGGKRARSPPKRVLPADHRGDVRHGHARDVPGGARSAMPTLTSWPSPAWTPWSWSAASSGLTWTRPRSTDCGSWPTGCARSTRSCPATSSWSKAGHGFAGSSPSRASASP